MPVYIDTKVTEEKNYNYS